MIYRIGIENNIEGRSLAWALDLPGCFAYASSGEWALCLMPEAIAEYSEWITSRNEGNTWIEVGDLELSWEETWEVYNIDQDFEVVEEGYEVNAWFRHDWKPLTRVEIDRGLKILTWSRADLLDSIAGLSPEQLAQKFPGERWSISGIISHVGGAEWWYLNSLGLAFPEDELQDEPFVRLEQTRQAFNETLSNLAGSGLITGKYGEFWSPRKMLRRAVWHERDHTLHIRKLIGSMQLAGSL